jgi:chemotaxis protein CheD
LNIVVSVSDARISADPADTIATYSLGSCIGVCLYDPAARIAGMLHYQLPTSTMDAAKAAANPLMFADTGMQHLLDAMAKRGANTKRLKVKIAGGAQILDDKNVFNIGTRNHAAIRKILWQLGLFIDKEDVGGSEPRTLYMAVADGSVVVKKREAKFVL